MQLSSIAFIAGGLTALSPCVLPILPIILGSASSKHRLGPFSLALGMIFSFTLMGAVIGPLLFNLGIGESTIRNASAIILILLAVILLIPKFELLFESKMANVSSFGDRFINKLSPDGLNGQFIIGSVLGLVWSPCAGPTLGAALLASANSENVLGSALTMMSFGIGAAIPLLLIAYLARGWVQKKMASLVRSAIIARKIFAVMMLIVGVSILTKVDKKLETELLKIIPEYITELSVRY